MVIVLRLFMQAVTSSNQRDVLKRRGVDPELVLSLGAIVVAVVVVVVEEVVVDLTFCGAGLVSKVVSSEDCSCTSVNIKKTIIVEVCRTVTNMPLFFMHYKTVAFRLISISILFVILSNLSI